MKKIYTLDLSLKVSTAHQRLFNKRTALCFSLNDCDMNVTCGYETRHKNFTKNVSLGLLDVINIRRLCDFFIEGSPAIFKHKNANIELNGVESLSKIKHISNPLDEEEPKVLIDFDMDGIFLMDNELQLNLKSKLEEGCVFLDFKLQNNNNDKYWFDLRHGYYKGSKSFRSYHIFSLNEVFQLRDMCNFYIKNFHLLKSSK